MSRFTTAPAIAPLRLRAFTLSELLISLSVMGLISALTLPTVFNSVDEAKKKSVFKETFNAIQQLVTTESAFGGTTKRSLDLVREGLNVKECTNRLAVTSPSHSRDRFGCVLQSGAHVMNLDRTGTGDSITLDWNGNAAPNRMGEDRISILVNWGTQSVNTMPGSNILASTGRAELRAGEVLPELRSKALFEAIF